MAQPTTTESMKFQKSRRYDPGCRTIPMSTTLDPHHYNKYSASVVNTDSCLVAHSLNIILSFFIIQTVKTEPFTQSNRTEGYIK
jgi:hypothetical protein